MFKIDGAGTLADKPARTAVGPVPGWFNQTPGTSPGTVVTAEYLNMLQAEILAVLAAATMAPDKADDTQLLKAIRRISREVAPVGQRSGHTGKTAPAGWILANGKSYGNSASGGTERANDDTRDLFYLHWNDYGDDELPVQTSGGVIVGRGASAEADWLANRRMTLPNYCDRLAVGRGDMGAAPAAIITIANSGLDTTKMGAQAGVAAKTFHFSTTTGPSSGGISTVNGGQSTAPSPHDHAVVGNTDIAPILNPMIVETVIIRL